MTTDRSTAAGTATTVTSADLSYSVRQRIFLYLGMLIVLLAFGAPGENWPSSIMRQSIRLRLQILRQAPLAIRLH